MIPKKIKKIYLNNVDEMQNREYIDLSQVWHDANEEPEKGEDIIALDIDGISVSGIYKDYSWYIIPTIRISKCGQNFEIMVDWLCFQYYSSYKIDKDEEEK